MMEWEQAFFIEHGSKFFKLGFEEEFNFSLCSKCNSKHQRFREASKKTAASRHRGVTVEIPRKTRHVQKSLAPDTQMPTSSKDKGKSANSKRKDGSNTTHEKQRQFNYDSGKEDNGIDMLTPHASEGEQVCNICVWRRKKGN